MESDRWVPVWDLSSSRKFAGAKSHAARVLYGLLKHCVDSYGRGNADTFKIWKQCWAALGAIEEVPDLLEQLHACELITLYDAGTGRFFAITAWEEHAGKLIRRRGASKYPAPPDPEHSGALPITPGVDGTSPDKSRLDKSREENTPLSPPHRGAGSSAPSARTPANGSAEMFPASPSHDAHEPRANGKHAANGDPARSARRRRDMPEGPREPQAWRHLLPEFPVLDDSRFGKAFDGFMQHRAEHELGKPYTTPALRENLRQLERLGVDGALALVATVVQGNWIRLKDHDGRGKKNGRAATRAGAGQEQPPEYYTAIRQNPDGEHANGLGPPPGLMELFALELEKAERARSAAVAQRNLELAHVPIVGAAPTDGTTNNGAHA